MKKIKLILLQNFLKIILNALFLTCKWKLENKGNFRNFQKSRKKTSKVTKNKGQVDHSFDTIFEYSAVHFENRNSDVEITPFSEVMTTR